LFALLTLGFLITTREDVQKLYSWLAIFSVIIAIVFIPLMFIPGQWLSDVLKEMGVFVTKFGNGWRRFVFLPTMGHFMMMAYWFPTLFRVTPLQARVLFGFGMVAVIAGGGRGAFFSVLIIFVVLSILRRKYLALCVMMLAFGGVILLSNALVQRGYGSSETPWIRVLSAVNPAMAHNIGVDDPIEWRIMRWKRAVEDIKLAPWIGMGYGGISGYFRMLSDVTATSRDLDLERDVATGTTHNGYISLARNLGIPITVLFIIIVLRRMWVHWRQGRRRDHPDKVFLEAHIFFCSYFAMMLAVMMTGAEIRTPVYWAFIALSFIIERLDKESGQSMQTLSRDVTAQNPIAV
jgi:O-antigen ligase